MIGADEAAEVARAHGLSLADAQALSALATSRDHAIELATGFAESGREHRSGDRDAERGLEAGRARARERHTT